MSGNNPPKAEDYRTTRTEIRLNPDTGIEELVKIPIFDGAAFTADLQKYRLQESNRLRTQNLQETANETANGPFKDCNNAVEEEKNGDMDVLLKFKLQHNETKECMYLSTFIKHIVNNPCNLFVKWVQKEENTPLHSEGYGMKPATSIFEVIYALRYENVLDKLKHVYWKIPIFGKVYIGITTLLRIQQHLEQEKEPIFELIKVPTDENFRLGNLYGMFGIGQTHAQNNNYDVYDIDSELELTKSLSPPFFKSEKLEYGLEIQVYVLDAAET